MRFTTRLGLALFVLGAVAILVSSGAFDAVTADRSANIDVAENDQEAILNVSYPNSKEIELIEQDRDGLCSVFPPCVDYNNRQVIMFVDNTSAEQLSISEISFDSETDSNLRIDSGPTAQTTGTGLAVVTASFECDASWVGFFDLSQNNGRGSITTDIVVSDGNLSVELSREVDIHCVPD